MPTLDELFNQTQQNTQPSLDDIFNGSQYQNQPQVNAPQTDSGEKSIYDIVGDAGRALLSPASTALEAISYLDKPRGAIAGGVNALLDNTDIVEGVKKGWEENTSWKEALPDQFQKDHPTATAVAGFVGDVALDPMWLLPPAKIAKGVAAGSKAIGLTDNVINPAVKAIKESELGAKAIAGAEDALGVNRLAKTGILDDFNAGRAADSVEIQDFTDELAALKKEFGNESANKATNVIEAWDRPKGTTAIKETSATDFPASKGVEEASNIVKSATDGTLFSKIKNGEITREQAFNTLRDAGEEIPDQLLQTHQRQFNLLSSELDKYGKLFMDAQKGGSPELVQQYSNKIKELTGEGKAQFGKDFESMLQQKTVPDYVYRDDVLNSIKNPNERKAIQMLTEKVIEQNKRFSDKIYDLGRINDAEYVEFMGGSHLRRSYEKFETADDFLKSVKKNGTPEEWQKVYSAYQKNKQGIGPSVAHKVDQNDFMRRQNLSDATLKKMGIISDAQYRVMDTFNRASKTIREEELLKNVGNMFGVTEDEAAKLSRNLPKSREYVPIPETKGYGALAGLWVPRDVANTIMGAMGTKPDNINKTWQKLVSWWKVGKLAAPAPIMRNFYSGLPMANVFGQVPVQSIPRYMAKVLYSYKNGGKNNEFIRELRSSGALDGQWIRGELDNILTGGSSGIKKIAEKGMEAFGTPDKFWRGVVFAYHRDKGKSVQEAGAIARKALLDYSSAPNWINTLSKTGVVPFAKFPFFAGKETAKALWNNPAQVTKFSKAQNQVNNEDRQIIMPDYMKARTLLPVGNDTRMVNGKPQNVQQNIDLSYNLPFSSDMSFGNPITDAAMLAKTGRNGIGMQIIKPGMTDKEKVKAWAEYIANSALPTVSSPYTLEKLYNGYKGNVDSKGRQYDLGDAALQTVMGVKNVPINTDEIFKSRMTKIGLDQRDITAMIGSIQRDQSMSVEQKKEKIQEHVQQLKELQKEAKSVQSAYRREKGRGAN